MLTAYHKRDGTPRSSSGRGKRARRPCTTTPTSVPDPHAHCKYTASVLDASIFTHLVHWFHYEYAPYGTPFYTGQIWGNLFVVPVAFVIASIFWPTLRRAVSRFIHGHTKEIERKLDHIILHHPDIPPLPPPDPTKPQG